MTLKVSRLKLIEAIKARQAAAQAEQKAAEQRAQPEFEAWRKAVVEKAARFVEIAKKAKTKAEIVEQFHYNNDLRFPSAPKDIPESRELERFTKALKQLALIEDATITLNESRDAEFLNLI